MKHEHATRPPTQLEVPSFLTGPLRSRTKHFTSVSPPSSHSSEAARGQWFASGISNTWWPEREQRPMPPARLPTPTLVTFPSDFRKWSQLLNRFTSLKSEPSAEAHCGNTRAVGASTLLCGGGLRPLKHSLTLGARAVTPEGLLSVCVDLKRRCIALKKYFQGSL